MRRAVFYAVAALLIVSGLPQAPARADSLSDFTPGAVRVIGQSRVPFVIPSSGTMGANGALSGITAVASPYPAAYVYLPANAIASGVAAGWYYAEFSSTTAATVYNNAYTSGTPAIPASKAAFATTGTGAYTQTTGALTAYSMTVPAGLIGPNGAVYVPATLSNNNSAGAKSTSLYLGASQLGSNSTTTTRGASYLFGVANAGSETVQVSAVSGGGVIGASAGIPYYSAVNTATATTISVKIGVATATDTNTLETATIQLTPGVP
ncbi:hypothetical protein GJ654_18860 [Rhodoblastus acidophilus]|uniref:Uncharacterized protein n=1 Tax=Rhodoblastus acidophilus TaxID=1074 RepID=A0A6N8DTZ8_RHOAC|nr:hypothetical protein [Rhodoblastus acidophilus]MCW2276390.1 hypothetical protein [Rhodoblastus acidophilus]MTV33045.1 hypothetical protein [Rhodoblastus acidophilus]